VVKLAHLLMLSTLIVWIAGSGCIGNDKSKVEDKALSPKGDEKGNGTLPENLDVDLSKAEFKELDSDMADLQSLLENASLNDTIVLKDVEMERK
jgi:hypothetical protein